MSSFFHANTLLTSETTPRPPQELATLPGPPTNDRMARRKNRLPGGASSARLPLITGFFFGELMPCHLDEFVAHVAAMLREAAAQEDIDRFLATIAPEYRAEVLTDAAALVSERKTNT